jgi:hypothetical protein
MRFPKTLLACVAMGAMCLISTYTSHGAEKSSPRVMLGMAIGKEGEIVAADPLIEYVLPDLDKRIDPQDVAKSARYLPPLSVNHEDVVTQKNGSGSQAHLCEQSIEGLFATAFRKYTGKDNPEDHVLLVARRTTPESRPLICVWWFTYVPKDKLKPADK